MLEKTAWIACNACGADQFQELSVASGWHIGRCRQCSLIYLNPMPFFKPSEEFSRMSLDFQYTRFQKKITEDTLEHDRAQIREQLQIAARLANLAGPGRFLDVGCGSGSSVKAASDLGWEAVGVDIDPDLVGTGRRQLGADLRCGTLPESQLESNSFHFVRLRDVIEHLPNPLEVLAEIRRLLAPRGVVLIATPNEASIPARVRLRLGFPRDRIATVSPPHHVHGFSPDTLALTIRRSGLELREVTTTTPVDGRYVTARNIKSRSPVKNIAWRATVALGGGSMLIAWAQQKGAPE